MKKVANKKLTTYGWTSDGNLYGEKKIRNGVMKLLITHEYMNEKPYFVEITYQYGDNPYDADNSDSEIYQFENLWESNNFAIKKLGVANINWFGDTNLPDIPDGIIIGINELIEETVNNWLKNESSNIQKNISACDFYYMITSLGYYRHNGDEALIGIDWDGINDYFQDLVNEIERETD